MPGEAQKIEKMVEIFSKRYIDCNQVINCPQAQCLMHCVAYANSIDLQLFVSDFNSPDTIFVLSYAVVLLNTDLHTRAVRRNSKRMSRADFVNNLRGIDAGGDLDQEMLEGIYDRIQKQEFKPGSDHVSQVSLDFIYFPMLLLIFSSSFSGFQS